MPHKKGGYYTIHELSFSKGRSEILDCRIERIEDDKKKEDEFCVTNPDGTELIAKTKELEIKPGHSARVCGKATQFRRSDDFVFETFSTPVINPEIEVIVPEGFEHRIEFGTSGERTRIAYSNRYILSGGIFSRPVHVCSVVAKKRGSRACATPRITRNCRLSSGGVGLKHLKKSKNI